MKAAIFSLLVFAMLMSLGVWQVKRLAWKEALLQNIHDRMVEKPAPLPEKIADPLNWEYRRVTLAGNFLYDHEFLVKPRTLDGMNGYHLITPFHRASGGIVFVNRGWVSDAHIKEVLRPVGLQQVEGIVQVPRKSTFTPDNRENDWYWADVNAMAASMNVKTLPLLVAVSEKKPGVYPVGGRVEVNIRNDHKQYAIFWFTMGLISQVIFFLRFRRKT